MNESLRPPSTLLIGPAGVGKTTSLATLLRCGLSLRMLATESSAPNRVLARCEELKIDSSRFDWTFVSPSPPSWASLLESARVINSMTLKDIADMRGGIARQDAKQWIAFLDAMNDFRSARTGASLGDVSSWDDSVAFVIDGLTGVNTMSRMLTVGLKPNPNPGEWGVMQGNIYTVLQKLCNDLNCFFICLAHVERETNEITGLSQLMVSTIGAKLAPRLPPLFTNVILAKRTGIKFEWSTAATNVDTKNGDLPLSETLEPSFSLIVDEYRRRRDAVRPPAQAAIASTQSGLQTATAKP